MNICLQNDFRDSCSNWSQNTIILLFFVNQVVRREVSDFRGYWHYPFNSCPQHSWVTDVGQHHFHTEAVRAQSSTLLSVLWVAGTTVSCMVSSKKSVKTFGDWRKMSCWWSFGNFCVSRQADKRQKACVIRKQVSAWDFVLLGLNAKAICEFLF